MDENEIGCIVVDAAVTIHKNLGPGLLESVYEAVLAQALSQRGLAIKRQMGIPFEYSGHRFEEGFRADVIVSARSSLRSSRWRP